MEKPIDYSDEDKVRVKELNDIMAEAWHELSEIQNKYKVVDVLPAFQEQKDLEEEEEENRDCDGPDWKDHDPDYNPDNELNN